MAMTRCFLCVPGLPKALWPEAVQTVVYIRNRSPSTFLRGRTPFEVWTGRIPKFHLKVFGATAFVHTKLLQRGWEGRFVSYSVDIDMSAARSDRPAQMVYLSSRLVTSVKIVIDTNYTPTTLTSDTIVTYRPCPLLIYWGQMKSKFDANEHAAPRDRNIVGSRWVFARKHDGTLNARWVAQGFRQSAGLDYGETFSHVCRIGSVRLILALANEKDWPITLAPHMHFYSHQ
ncbi:unnamed protein product [Discosporangium mesarthrocarpum]